jgi:hypothetical protein
MNTTSVYLGFVRAEHRTHMPTVHRVPRNYPTVWPTAWNDGTVRTQQSTLCCTPSKVTILHYTGTLVRTNSNQKQCTLLTHNPAYNYYNPVLQPLWLAQRPRQRRSKEAKSQTVLSGPSLGLRLALEGSVGLWGERQSARRLATIPIVSGSVCTYYRHTGSHPHPRNIELPEYFLLERIILTCTTLHSPQVKGKYFSTLR